LAAPVSGGFLLGMKVQVAYVPLAPALLLGVGAVASIILAVVCRRKLDGFRPAELDVCDQRAKSYKEPLMSRAMCSLQTAVARSLERKR